MTVAVTIFVAALSARPDGRKQRVFASPEQTTACILALDSEFWFFAALEDSRGEELRGRDVAQRGRAATNEMRGV